MFAGAIESAVITRLSSSAAVLADHAAAYAEIIIADAQASARSAGQRLWAATVIVIASTFTLAIGCTWLIAASWDTSAHLPVMLGLLVIGIVAALCALQSLNRHRRSAPRPMALTLAEWAKDRQMLKELLNSSESDEA